MTIDTSKLKRYKPGYVHSNDGPGYISMLARDDGEYVRLEDVKAITSALEQPLTQQRGEATECVCPDEALRLRYFADGPQGSFFTNNLQLARDLVNLYDKDDDWTITDLENPYGPSDNGS